MAIETQELQAWKLDEGGELTWFLAHSEARFIELVQEHYREEYMVELDVDLEPVDPTDCGPCSWERMNPTEEICIRDSCTGEEVMKTCAEWAAQESEGVLCSTLY